MVMRKGQQPKRRPRRAGELTPVQSRMVDEFLKDLDIGGTAQRSGISYQVAYKTLHLAHVQREVQRRKQMRAERSGIDGDRVLVELSRIGFSDIGDVLDWKTAKDKDGREQTVLKIKDLKDLSPAARAAIAEIKPTKHGLHVKFHDKKGALDSLAKHLGLFSDEVKLTVPVQFIVERSSDRRPADEAQPAIEGEVVGRA